MCSILDLDNSLSELACGLMLVSNAARSGTTYYEALATAHICRLTKPFLDHPDAGLRAKACNLIGNICRHSAQFYTEIQESGVLLLLIRACMDADSTTRKFACFAIGNAGMLSQQQAALAIQSLS